MATIASPTPCTSNTGCPPNGFCDFIYGTSVGGYCMLTTDNTENECNAIDGALINKTCVCPTDMLFDVTANSCLPAPCTAISPCGYYFEACSDYGPCFKNTCSTTGVSATLDPVCNIVSPFEGTTCPDMPYGTQTSAEFVGIETPKLSASDVPNVAVLTFTPLGGVPMAYTLTPSEFLGTVLVGSYYDTNNNNAVQPVTCNYDPTLNVGKNTGGNTCYLNALASTADANGCATTTTSVFLDSVGTKYTLLEFYTTRESTKQYYAGTNFGNDPGQTNLFVMFANADNVNWLRPQQCPYDSGDPTNPCTLMGAGMRCVPGTTPTMVSNCQGVSEVCGPNGWSRIDAILPPGYELGSMDPADANTEGVKINGSNVLSNGVNGAPIYYSVWGCSAEPVSAAAAISGSICPTGFEDKIIYDSVKLNWVGACTRVPEFNNLNDPTGSQNSLVYNFCNNSLLGSPPYRQDVCSNDTDMCWSSSCSMHQGSLFTPDSILAEDTIGYIPLGYAYPSVKTNQSDITGYPFVGYTVCTTADSNSKGCSQDLQRDWGAWADYYVTGCEGSGADPDPKCNKTWTPVTNH